MNVIEVKNLCKKYKQGSQFELKNLNLGVKKGYITGIIGNNGAGKTTLIKLILNMLYANSGTIRVLGKENLHSLDDQNEEIGFVMDKMFFPEQLQIKELNKILQKMYKKWDTKLFFSYMEKFQLPIDSKVQQLSTGMKKKLEIAIALSHRPKLLILDEPTSGLDPVVRNEILDILLDYMQDEEHTILLSTHITSDLDKIADEIILLNNGNIVLQDSLETIKEQYGIWKGTKEELDQMDRNYIVAKRERQYFCEVLIKDKNSLLGKNSSIEVDSINLEQFMLFMVKEELRC